MKRIFCIFLLILIINSIFSSDCTNKIANNKSETSTENISPTQIANTDSTNPPATGATTPAEPANPPADTTTPAEANSPEEDRRRVLDVLNEDDCKNLKTQDDNKYQCVVSSDRSRCQEVEKEGSKILYLSFPLALIFIIL